jgi:hypothetical protein
VWTASGPQHSCRGAQRVSRSARRDLHAEGARRALATAMSLDQRRWRGAFEPPLYRTGRQRCRRCPGQPAPRRRPGAPRHEASAGGPGQPPAPSSQPPSGIPHVPDHWQSRSAKMTVTVSPAPAAPPRRGPSQRKAFDPCASPRHCGDPGGPPLRVAALST